MKARESPLPFGVFPFSLLQVADAVVRMLPQSQTEGQGQGSGEFQAFREFREFGWFRWCRWCR